MLCALPCLPYNKKTGTRDREISGVKDLERLKLRFYSPIKREATKLLGGDLARQKGDPTVDHGGSPNSLMGGP